MFIYFTMITEFYTKNSSSHFAYPVSGGNSCIG